MKDFTIVSDKNATPTSPKFTEIDFKSVTNANSATAAIEKATQSRHAIFLLNQNKCYDILRLAAIKNNAHNPYKAIIVNTDMSSEDFMKLLMRLSSLLKTDATLQDIYEEAMGISSNDPKRPAAHPMLIKRMA